MEEVISLTQKLIRINSQNPGATEKEIAYFIRDYLMGLGLKAKIYEFEKDRLNVVARIPSRRRRKRILFTPHIDTVPVTGKWRYPPLSGKIVNGRIYGRGATDCKSNVGVSLAVIKELAESKFKPQNLDIVFAFTADEETGSEFGMKPLIKKLKGIDYGVVLDVDEFDIIIAQKGLLHLRIEVFGREAHGAFPEKGINAIEKSIYALSRLFKEGLPCKSHSLLKKPTINIGTFYGGDKVNMVAGHAAFELDIRFPPPLNKERIVSRLKLIFSKYLPKYKLTVLAHQEPIEVDRNSFLIKIVEDTLKRYRIKPVLKASFGATVINFLKNEGIEAFAFGFGTEGCAHAKNEYVAIANLTNGVKVLKDYIVSLDRYLD